MARALRRDIEGSFHHVMVRGNGGQNIFKDIEDRERFLEILKHAKTVHRFRLYAYCLMSNHVHLLLRVGTSSLSYTMQRILTTYARSFNIRHKKIGHLFQGRFKSIPCTKDSYLLELVRYIHRNPIRAGVIQNIAECRWTGHQEYLGTSRRGLIDPLFILKILANNSDAAQGIYLTFVSKAEKPAITGVSISPITQRSLPHNIDKPGLKADTLQSLADQICKNHNIKTSLLCGASKVRRLTPIRKKFIAAAIQTGHSPSSIARFLNRSHTAILKLNAEPQ